MDVWHSEHIQASYVTPCTTAGPTPKLLASCLINARPLPAHRPAADNNSLIGCTRQRPDRWLVAAYAHFVYSLCPFRSSFGCVLLLNQMFWKQCAVRQYPSDLCD